MTDTKLKLYDFPLSGHAHRIRLALSLMGLDYELVPVDLASGEQKRDWFTAMNPAGQVPVLKDGDTVVSESTAILTYLAKKFPNGEWIPTDAFGAAEVEKWFVAASTGLAAGPARARLINLFGAQYDKAETVENGHKFLALLETALDGKNYLVAGRPTLADVAIYSYVAHAPEGDVSLEDYPAVRVWLARIEGLSGFIGMPKTDTAKAA